VGDGSTASALLTVTPRAMGVDPRVLGAACLPRWRCLPRDGAQLLQAVRAHCGGRRVSGGGGAGRLSHLVEPAGRPALPPHEFCAAIGSALHLAAARGPAMGVSPPPSNGVPPCIPAGSQRPRFCPAGRSRRSDHPSITVTPMNRTRLAAVRLGVAAPTTSSAPGGGTSSMLTLATSVRHSSPFPMRPPAIPRVLARRSGDREAAVGVHHPD